MNIDHLNDLKQLIATSVQTINSRFDVLERRFDGVNTQFREIDMQFDNVNARLDGHDEQFSEITRRLYAIDARFDDTDRKLAVINTRFDDNEIIQNEILDTIGREYEGYSKALRAQADHIDDHGRRIVKLEKHVA